MAETQTEQAQRADSLDERETNSKDKKKKDKSKRPANSAFRQQRLKAWQPILTPKTVLPLFFAVGIIFAPIGGLLLWASTIVQEISIDYTDCINRSPLIDGNATGGLENIPNGRVSKTFKEGSDVAQPAAWGHYNGTRTYNNGGVEITVENTNICRLEFDVENVLEAPVYMYYRLTNFYQNHRRYVKSYNQDQLAGDVMSYGSIDGSDCAPLDVRDNKIVYPCGLIANSIFNDTFEDPVLLNPANSSNEREAYAMTNRGIAWDADKDLFKKTGYSADQIVPPPNWEKRWPAYNSSLPPPDLSTWEEFHVWMRTAGLPTFSKMARRQDNVNMAAGRYQMDIWDEFNVTRYEGTKSLLISTRTVMGGRNPFLGIAYLVVGGLCIILGALFTATYIIKPRKLGDHTYLSWNNEQPATATATGRSLGDRGST